MAMSSISSFLGQLGLAAPTAKPAAPTAKPAAPTAKPAAPTANTSVSSREVAEVASVASSAFSSSNTGLDSFVSTTGTAAATETETEVDSSSFMSVIFDLFSSMFQSDTTETTETTTIANPFDSEEKEVEGNDYDLETILAKSNLTQAYSGTATLMEGNGTVENQISEVTTLLQEALIDQTGLGGTESADYEGYTYANDKVVEYYSKKLADSGTGSLTVSGAELIDSYLSHFDRFNQENDIDVIRVGEDRQKSDSEEEIAKVKAEAIEAVAQANAEAIEAVAQANAEAIEAVAQANAEATGAAAQAGASSTLAAAQAGASSILAATQAQADAILAAAKAEADVDEDEDETKTTELENFSSTEIIESADLTNDYESKSITLTESNIESELQSIFSSLIQALKAKFGDNLTDEMLRSAYEKAYAQLYTSLNESSDGSCTFKKSEIIDVYLTSVDDTISESAFNESLRNSKTI